MNTSPRSQGLRLPPSTTRLAPRSVSAAPAPKRPARHSAPVPVPRADPDEPRRSGIARLVELGKADDALTRTLTIARLTRLGVVK